MFCHTNPITYFTPLFESNLITVVHYLVID